VVARRYKERCFVKKGGPQDVRVCETVETSCRRRGGLGNKYRARLIVSEKVEGAIYVRTSPYSKRANRGPSGGGGTVN
jgi:hypothetical protein